MKYEILESNSSLVQSISFEDSINCLTVKVTYGTFNFKCDYNTFLEFSTSKSLGNYFQKYIKQLPIMSENEKRKPKGINKASDKKRFIKMSLDTEKISRKMFTVGENGKTYFNITLQLLPDGTVDRFENLGMVTQDVPQEVYDREKNLPKEQRTQGPILGNGKELWWPPLDGVGGQQRALTDEEAEALSDDLPF